MRRLFLLAIAWLSIVSISLADSTAPSLYLGMPVPSMIQPYVSVEVLEETSPGVYQNLGPSAEPVYIDIFGIPFPVSDGHNSLLLDTGANSILIVDAAAQDLENAGYQTEGTFWEFGISGYTEYDVSASYRFSFAGADEVPHYLDGAGGQGVRMQSNPDSILDAPVDSGGKAGIVGMPAMTGRVTTLNLNQGGNTYPSTPIEEWTIDELLAFLLEGTSISTNFSDNLAAGTGNRYTVALDNRIQFSAEDGLPTGSPPGAPLPEYADVPFLTAKVNAVGVDSVFREMEGTFLLDTGAQFSIISRRMAFGLGLDEDGDGYLEDEAFDFIEVAGVGGTRSLPIMIIDELRLPTNEGVELVWNDPSDPAERLGVQVLVMDLFPSGDIDYSGTVDANDIAIIQGNLGLTVPEGDVPSGDLDGNGVVNEFDLAIAEEQLGESVFLDGIFGIDMLTSGRDYDIDTLEMYGVPFFDSVHFDFRDWDSGDGTLVLDINSEYSTVVMPVIAGDANGDGKVDGSDVTILADNWQGNVSNGAASGDFNGDGIVDGSDVTILADNWQTGVFQMSTAVPEPSTWVMLVMVGLFVAIPAWKKKI